MENGGRGSRAQTSGSESPEFGPLLCGLSPCDRQQEAVVRSGAPLADPKQLSPSLGLNFPLQDGGMESGWTRQGRAQRTET
ncbi:uncharacterized protein C16orf74 homolog isoform X2 [Panthera tigris]|uniref:uncharacterized protein C16orf74 homolog isoform X2 n=1 Tax=Panthera tigris TaxID=9694 RepID=UPI001C6FBC33|nr:uncharacterized protein C16orf74 homolog isoform X2 [Panthera tigris]